MFETSQTIDKLAAALAKAQAEIEGAEKDRANPAFRARYATLAAVWEAWQAVGPKNGLAVSQWPGEFIEGKLTMVSMLSHSSGEWMRQTLTMPVAKADPQGYGSATTYARRYALMALAGIAPEDDDGNAASAAPRKQHPTPAQLNPAQDDLGGDDDRKAKWRAWVEEHSGKLRKMEAASDADAVREWKRKYDSALTRLRAADAALHDELVAVFDDVATALRPNFTAAG
jgi:hypothetical protein